MFLRILISQMPCYNQIFLTYQFYSVGPYPHIVEQSLPLFAISCLLFLRSLHTRENLARKINFFASCPNLSFVTLFTLALPSKSFYSISKALYLSLISLMLFIYVEKFKNISTNHFFKKIIISRFYIGQSSFKF